MTSVPGYQHSPGEHCGSTALSNLLSFHGTKISEETAFGLGAGACFYYVTLEESSPTRWFNGRTARLEENFRDLSGAALALRTFAPGDQEAWRAARAEIDAGNPVLLLTDLFYLDHYGNSAHFPGHAVNLVGYDTEYAQLSDTGFEGLQSTSLENLELARHGDHPAYPLRGHMFTVSAPIDPAALRAAVPRAIEHGAKEMLEPALGAFAGLPALRRFAAEAGAWPEVAADWRWCARFGYQVIERRGTGGGAFRLIYSRFLAEFERPEADLAAAAASAWSDLAAALQTASEQESPKAAAWRRIERQAERVAESEDRLWTALAGA